MRGDVVQFFWKCIHHADFDSLNIIMSDDAHVWLPNSKEVFKGKSKYIEFNKRYPDRWYVELDKIFECGETVISVARIYNAKTTISFYVTSFFKVNNNIIDEITEYWGENGEPPEWRLDEKLSEKYE